MTEARIYFSVREGARFTAEEDGMEFLDIGAAEHEAAETAASIGRDLLPKGTARGHGRGPQRTRLARAHR